MKKALAILMVLAMCVCAAALFVDDDAAADTTYTLNYGGNGEGLPASQTATSASSPYNMTVSNTVPTRTGYTFLGWATSALNASKGIVAYVGGDTIQLTNMNNTKTIYSTWEYDDTPLNGVTTITGSGTQADPFTVFEGVSAKDLYETYNNCYWQVGCTVDVPYYSSGAISYDSLTVTAGHNLKTTAGNLVTNAGGITNTGTVSVSMDYHHYGTEETVYVTMNVVAPSNTYTLAYNANNGSGAPAPQTATSSASTYSFTVSYTEPTRSGHTFLGWSFNSGASTASYVGGNTVTLSSDNAYRTLYAVWQANLITYSLAYNANGGSGAPATQTTTSVGSSIGFNVPNDEPTRSGYTFLGWSFNNAAQSADYVAGDVVWLYQSNPTRTLYAVWQQAVTTTYSLVYDANGGSGAPATESQTTSSDHYDFTVSDTIPTRAGYTFLGWADSSSSAAAEYVAGDTIQVSTPTTRTIYAVWVEEGEPTYTFTLKFNGNGGSGVPVTMTATGSEILYDFTIPDTKPVKDGTIFMGWSLAPTATAASYTAGSTITVAADQEVILYAVYNEDNSFSFSFDFLIKQIANTFFGGSSSMAGLAMIVICWLLLVAVLANFKAPISYSVAPMIPVVIIFAAMGIISTDITMIVIVVCAVFSAVAVRNIVQGD